ncbi:MAG: hypothetical protein KGM43_06500 [Planctomycetota bacterium]|nr:hypothetical protein [Planctomycetota bacterium]
MSKNPLIAQGCGVGAEKPADLDHYSLRVAGPSRYRSPLYLDETPNKTQVNKRLKNKVEQKKAAGGASSTFDIMGRLPSEFNSESRKRYLRLAKTTRLGCSMLPTGNNLRA